MNVMDDFVFTGNVLLFIKEHFLDYDKSMYWLDKLKPDITSDYRRAFWWGGHDYVCFTNLIPYTVHEEYKLPELQFVYGYNNATQEQRDYAWANAMPTWLAYNLITIGCNQLC